MVDELTHGCTSTPPLGEGMPKQRQPVPLTHTSEEVVHFMEENSFAKSWSERGGQTMMHLGAAKKQENS
jgi:hypothetical protein